MARSGRDVLEGIKIDDLVRKFGPDILSGPDRTDRAVLSGGRDDSGRVHVYRGEQRYRCFRGARPGLV